MIGMQNPSPTDRKSGIQYQESGTYVLERSWNGLGLPNSGRSTNTAICSYQNTSVQRKIILDTKTSRVPVTCKVGNQLWNQQYSIVRISYLSPQIFGYFNDNFFEPFML